MAAGWELPIIGKQSMRIWSQVQAINIGKRFDMDRETYDE
jgi:hypothetical protein